MSRAFFLFTVVLILVGGFSNDPLRAAPYVTMQDLLIDQDLGGFNNLDEPTQTDPVTLGASFTLKQGGREGTLRVTALIAKDWHVYSVTQPKGGPIRTKITVLNDEVTIQSDFVPDSAPHVVEKDPVFGIRVEDHEHQVTWSAPIRVDEGVEIKDLKLQVRFDGQTCVTRNGQLGSCLPLGETIAAEFAGFKGELQKAEEKFTPKSSVNLSGKITSVGPMKPGSKITVRITAAPIGDYHIYPYTESGQSELGTGTLIALNKVNKWSVGKTIASNVPETKMVEGLVNTYHHQPVTWTTDITIPSDAAKKTYSVGGLMAFQMCTDRGCEPPESVNFVAEIPLAKNDIVEVPLKFSEGIGYDKVRKEVERLYAQTARENEDQSKSDKENDKIQVQLDTPEQIEAMAELYDADEKINYVTFKSSVPLTIWTAMFGAFLGGMILNLMPCVFPVLGIKVMGFVEQAGSEPGKIRMHGIAFAAGLIVSMWILGGFILFLKYSLGREVNWGEQMGNPYFVASIILLLFVLGLNMAGVFEIGTSLTRAGGSIQGKKGFAASFFSGVLTTLIATPCSGPFLGAAMSYTLSQTALIAMFLFTVFALGIASPYLFLSFFPALISRLPRPGAWMETFKITMSFALFATAVFFLRTFGNQTGLDGMWWLAMAMVVIGLALFFYGKWSLPHLAPVKRVFLGWALPAVIAGYGFWMAYDAAGYDAPPVAKQGHLPWMQWNPGKVEHTLAMTGKPIWVDYTADW